MRRVFSGALLVAFVVSTPVLHAQTHPAVPSYSSLPGAPYTIYLDFAGFNYTGTWAGGTPGNVPAYDIDSNSASFSATELSNIQKIWAWTAEAYAPFKINVTTIDPAGTGKTDAQRQSFYDATARVQHTIIGSDNAWFGNAGGVSYLGEMKNSNVSNGHHTNWVFTVYSGNQSPGTFLQYVAEAAAHENGHALNLSHQSDVNGSGTTLTTYSGGNGTGSGSVAPIMGVSYYSERGTWRNGTVEGGGGAFQNDPAVIQNYNNGIGNLINDGIGHSVATATPLSLNGQNINAALAKGIIVPVSNNSPNPIGVGNYTSDFFSFTTTGGNVTINLVAGSERITTGVADDGATLDGTLKILNSSGVTLFTVDTASLGETFNQFLAAGDYFIEVDSAGGKTLGSAANPSSVSTQYYDMGSFFLTGSIPFAAVPEPTTVALCGGALVFAGWQTWRRRRQTKLDLEQNVKV